MLEVEALNSPVAKLNAPAALNRRDDDISTVVPQFHQGEQVMTAETISPKAKHGRHGRTPATSARNTRCPRPDGATWTDHRTPLRDAEVLLPQGAGLLRAEIHSSAGLGTLAGSLSPAQGRRWAPRPLERPALARALQPRGLRLAY